MSRLEKALNKFNTESRSRSKPADKVSEDARVTPLPPVDQGRNRPQENLPCAKSISLDKDALAQSGLISHDDDSAELTASEFRRIKRPLIRNAFDLHMPSGNLILVTSSLANEGKTFTALNLALSVALEMDRTALLIDADVAKPRLTSVLGLSERPGLLDVLKNPSMELGSVIRPTDVSGLTVLPTGRPRSESTELLASQRMDSLIRELAERYENRVIIIDSPPLLETSEASVLASHVGQVLFVVAALQTPEGAVCEALESLDRTGEISVVLNKATRGHSSGYYVGYGYGITRDRTS